MKVGAALVAAIAAFGLIASVTALTPDNSEQETIAAARAILDEHLDKKMYSEAVEDYQNLLRLPAYANDYSTWEKYKKYCFDHGFNNEFIEACRKMIQLDPKNDTPANDVLEWLKENSPDGVYEWLAFLREKLDPEKYTKFGEYYDTIKGDYVTVSNRYTQLSDWAAAVFDAEKRANTYLFGYKEEEGYFILNYDGKTIIDEEQSAVLSYSYNESLFAVEHEGQNVYVNADMDRKRVPFDYKTRELINNEYLGPYYNGIANFCDKDGKWGFINSRADVMYAGYKRTTPGSEGVFAVQNENGLWTILHLNNGGLVNIGDTEYDDLKTDEYGYMIKNGVFFGHSGGSWYMNKIVVDEDGNYGVQKLDTAYEDAKVFGDLGAVKISGKWGFVNYDGELVIPAEYEDAKSFSCGFAAVKRNGKWGYADMAGKVIIECTFEDANSFNRYGIGSIKRDGEWNLIQLKEYEISEGVYK